MAGAGDAVFERSAGEVKEERRHQDANVGSVAAGRQVRIWRIPAVPSDDQGSSTHGLSSLTDQGIQPAIRG